VRAFNHRRCGLSIARARERFKKIKNPPTRKCAIIEFVDIFQRAHYQDHAWPCRDAAFEIEEGTETGNKSEKK